MSRLLIQSNPVVPRGQFFAQDGRNDLAAPGSANLDPGTPQTPMGRAEATTGADGPAQLKPGGRWVGDTWCNILTKAEDGSRAITVDGTMRPPEARRDDPNLFLYADRQWHVRRRVFTDNLILLLDRDVIHDPSTYVDSSVDIAGHWVGIYKPDQYSFAALTQPDASFIVRAFDKQITNDNTALDTSSPEDLASLAESRLKSILEGVPQEKPKIRGSARYPAISLRNHRISVEHRDPLSDYGPTNQAIASALAILPDPFLWLIDSIYFKRESKDGPVSTRPGGVSATAPEALYDKRYVDVRAVKTAQPGAIARNLLNVSAREFLTYEIALVPEDKGFQIVLNKPVDMESWHRPSDFVSDLDAAWILAHRADLRHPQLIRHFRRVTWPLTDGVAQDLAMVISDDGSVNSQWVSENPHLALLYSGWLSRINTQGMMLPGEVNGPLERSVWLFLQKKHAGV